MDSQPVGNSEPAPAAIPSFALRAVKYVAQWIYALVVMAAVCTALVFAQAYTGKYYLYGCFSSSGEQVAVYAFTSILGRYAVIHIQNGPRDVGVVFDENDWRSFQDIWKKAKAGYSPLAPQLHQIGFYNDETAPASTIAVLTGSGIQFQLREVDTCTKYSFGPSGMKALDKIFGNVTAFMEKDAAPVGSPMGGGNASNALQVTRDVMTLQHDGPGGCVNSG
jgi:hypothetical protein